MNRSVLLAATVTALAVTVTGSAAASAAGHDDERATYRFVATQEDGNFAMADLGPASAPGEQDISDVIAFTEALTRDGKAAGLLHLAGIGVDHTRMLTQVTGTIALADGTVEFAGIVPKAPTFSLAVTGGTGRYVGRSGTLDLDVGESQEKVTLTLTPGQR